MLVWLEGSSKILTVFGLKSSYPSTTTTLGIWGGKIPISRTWRNVKKGWQDCSMGWAWSVQKGDKVKLLLDNWLPHFGTLRNFIQRPLTKEDEVLTIKDIFVNISWDLSKISLVLSHNVIQTLYNFSLTLNNSKEETPR